MCCSSLKQHYLIGIEIGIGRTKKKKKKRKQQKCYENENETSEIFISFLYLFYFWKQFMLFKRKWRERVMFVVQSHIFTYVKTHYCVSCKTVYYYCWSVFNVFLINQSINPSVYVCIWVTEKFTEQLFCMKKVLLILNLRMNSLSGLKNLNEWINKMLKKTQRRILFGLIMIYSFQ